MTYDDLVVLIPSYSLDDFPTELGEKEAAGLLNAFAVVWHPALLAVSGVIPSWHRADEPPDDLENRLVIVPSCSDEWLPTGWVDQARSAGALVLAGYSDRQEMLGAVLEGLHQDAQVDPDLVADFLALGSCYLQMELLTRHMHYYSNVDEVYLQREAIAAAEAAVADDAAAAKTHLRTCFEALTETRERFYPVDCYLIDLCLLIPRLAEEHLDKTLERQGPVNLLVTAADLEEIAAQKPEIIDRLRERWSGGTVNLIGGELREGPLPLLPLESVLWQFRQGQEVFQKLLDRTPKTWGRRRYGFATQLPQILSKFGYHAALHITLDDGIHPDAEQSKIRWEGCDGTVLDAMARIPLAADTAASYLSFSQRMAESMETDQVAAVILAHWPQVKAPWFDDLQRMDSYSPALGRFVSLDDFVEQTDDPGRLSTFEEKEYLSPFLTQAVAGRQTDPISRYASHFWRRSRFDAGCWYRSLARLLTGKPVDDERQTAAEQTIEQAAPEGTAEAIERAERLLEEFVPDSARQLADMVLAGAADEPGFLLLNSLSFPRRVSVDLPTALAPPQLGGAVKAVQFDGTRKSITVDVPGSGFAWIPAASASAPITPPSSALLAEENLLRNEFFEVHVNDVTGGIRQIKGYGRSPNRLSQQLAFRFPRERTILVGDGEDAEEIKTFYSEMRCLTSEITCDGPAMGEIVTTGEIVDQKDNSRLAGFRNTFRVWRGRPVVEVETELNVERMPDGGPWSNYYAARFAWNDSTASLTRSVLGGAHGFRSDRFESSHYFEIAEGDQRTTILHPGLPFHRKTGMRMLDTLLITAGETRRQFRFVIAVDQSYPIEAARDMLTPVAVVPTQTGPPAAGSTGWFFHLAEKNVQITRVLPLADEPPRELETWEEHDYAEPPPGGGFALRLVETEGRHRQVKLRCFKTPTSARQRDFQGRTLIDLNIEDDVVQIHMTAHEIADVELRFRES